MKNRIIETEPAASAPAPLIRLVPAPSSGRAALAALDLLNPFRQYLYSVSPQSRRSVLANLGRVARLLRVSVEEVPWRDLRAHHVEGLRAALQEMRPEGRRRRARDARLSPATVNATLAAIKGVLRQARLAGAIPADEYQLILEVRGVRGRRLSRSGRAVEFDEVAALLDACEADETASGARDAALIALLAGAGLRRSEAASLDVADWRERRHALRVQGKGEKDRLVFLEDGGTRRALHAWLKLRGPEAGPLLTPVDALGRVELRRLSGQAVYKALAKRWRQAELRGTCSPHSLRRFFASHLLECGAGIEEVKELLGHASVETTAVYDRRGERAQRRAARLIRLPYRGAGGRKRKRRRKRRRRGA